MSEHEIFEVNSMGAGDAGLIKGIESADESAISGLSDEAKKGILRGDPKFANELKQVLEERNKRLAPAGSLRLPELLDQRRIEYAIPNEVFTYQACYDKVLVFQIPEEKGETYGDTGIIMPDNVKSATERESPLGIICSAGLQARDELVTNGLELGHKVAVVKLIPWKKDAGSTHGHRHEVMVIKPGDIIGSLDLAEAIKRGDATTVWDTEAECHKYVDRNGECWNPLRPESTPEV